MVLGSKVVQLAAVGIGLAFAGAFAATLSGCHARTIAVRPATHSTQPTQRAQSKADMERFVTYMCGHFSSAAQASADPEFRDISLKVVRIWDGREDSRFAWLYVEQALASDLDHPYRQRIYRVSPSQRGEVRTDVYSLPAPAEAIGAWRNASLLDMVSVRDLTIREGCSVYLTLQGDRFVGETRNQECPSELSGAKYATSQAEFGPDGMVTWDRGFDASGKQVWGATKGGYRFDKLVTGSSAEKPFGK